MRIEIDVDIPNGWEFDEYGILKFGDNYLSSGGKILWWTVNADSNTNYIKIKKKWKRPDYIKSGTWIAMDANRQWFLYDNEPIEEDGCYNSEGEFVDIDFINKFLEHKIIPPKCKDWEKSKTQI